MAYTRDWIGATFADHSKFKTQPGYIRYLQTDIEERLKNFFYGFISGETQEGVKHFDLLVQATAPGSAADMVKFYAKDVAGKAEAFIRNENNQEIQIVAGAEGLVSNDFLLSANAVRSGWTDRTATYAGRHLRVGATALATGGSATLTGSSGSHLLTIAQIPLHYHTYLKGSPGTGTDLGHANWEDNCQVAGNSSSVGGGAGHTHLLTGVANTPLYVDMKLFQKN